MRRRHHLVVVSLVVLVVHLCIRPWPGEPLSAAAAAMPVRIAGAIPAYFPSIQSAYDSSGQGAVLQSQAVVLDEHLVFGKESGIALQGGYDPEFGSIGGMTVVRGDLVIASGTIVISNTVIAPDITAPKVISVSPASGSFGVPVNCVITVEFDEALSAAPFTPGILSVKDNGGTTVAGTVSVSGRRAVFTPVANLATSTAYVVTVAPGIRDVAGNATTAPFSWQFSTTYSATPFEYSITPLVPGLTAARGSLATMVLDMNAPGGTPYPVTLSVDGCPPDAVCSVSPNPAFGGGVGVQQYVSLLMATSSLTPARSYLVLVRGDGGGVRQSTTVSVTVTLPDTIEPRKVWGEGGVAVTSAPGIQLYAVAAGDGSGGAVFLWEDSRTTVGVPDIFGQRISSGGVPLWAVDGIPLVTADNIRGEPANQSSLAAADNGVGDLFFSWEDTRNLQADIFAQRIGGAGVPLWQSDGVPVCTACWLAGPPCANAKQEPQMVYDGAGGTINTWYELRDGFHYSVWAQRLTAGGAPVWQTDGVPVAYGSFSAMFPRIVPDGSGGAIIFWEESKDGSIRYRAQRIDVDGAPLWPGTGVAVAESIAQRGLGGYAAISDGSGGAIIAWVKYSPGDGTSDIYTQRIGAGGNLLWNPAGVPVCSRAFYQYSPTMAPDGTGGAILAWEDPGASPPGTGQQWIYAQRISAQGNPLWQADGILLYSFHGSGPQAASDGAGGGIVVWDGFRVAGPNQFNPAILAQHLTGDGRQLWTPNGFEIYSLAGNYGMAPRIISDGLGGGIIHWTDYRLTGSGDWDIFAQRLNDKTPQ